MSVRNRYIVVALLAVVIVAGALAGFSSCASSAKNGGGSPTELGVSKRGPGAGEQAAPSDGRPDRAGSPSPAVTERGVPKSDTHPPQPAPPVVEADEQESRRTVILQAIAENDGAPVADVMCTVEGRVAWTTGADGRAELSLPPLAVMLRLVAAGYQDHSVRVEPDATSVLVSLLRLDGEGLVTDADGNPVSAEVRITHLAALNDALWSESGALALGLSFETQSGEDGRFRYPIRPVRQHFAARALGKGHGVAVADRGAKQVSIRLAQGAAFRFVVESDAAVSGSIWLRGHRANSPRLHSVVAAVPTCEITDVQPYTDYLLEVDFIPGGRWELHSPGPGEVRTVPIFYSDSRIEIEIETESGGPLPEFSALWFRSRDGLTRRAGEKLNSSTVAIPVSAFPPEPTALAFLADEKGQPVAEYASKITLTSPLRGKLVVTPLDWRSGTVVDETGRGLSGCTVTLQSQTPRRPALRWARATTDAEGKFSIPIARDAKYKVLATSSTHAGSIEYQDGTAEIRVVAIASARFTVTIDGPAEGQVCLAVLTQAWRRGTPVAVRAGTPLTLRPSADDDGVLLISESLERWFPKSSLRDGGTLSLAPDTNRSVWVKVVAHRDPRSGQELPAVGSNVQVKSVDSGGSGAARGIVALAVTDANGIARLDGCPWGELNVEVTHLGSTPVSSTLQGESRPDRPCVVILTYADSVNVVRAFGSCVGVAGLNGLFSFSVFQLKERLHAPVSAQQGKEKGLKVVNARDLRRTPGGYTGLFDPEYPYLYVSGLNGDLHTLAGELKKVNGEWRADLNLP